MLVQAIQMGYYGHLRRKPGAKFELKPVKGKSGLVVPAEAQFSSLWMRKLNEKQAAQFREDQEELDKEDGYDDLDLDAVEQKEVKTEESAAFEAHSKPVQLTKAQKIAATKAANAAKKAQSMKPATDSAEA